MPQIVEAKCPGCKNVLRIPANWINQPMRCKQCGLIFQNTKKVPGIPPVAFPTSAVPTSPPPKAIPLGRAAMAAGRARKPGSHKLKLAFIGTWLLGIAALVLVVYGSQFLPGDSSGNDALASNAALDFGLRPLEQYRPPDPIVPEQLPPDPPRPAPRPVVVVQPPPQPKPQPETQPKPKPRTPDPQPRPFEPQPRPRPRPTPPPIQTGTAFPRRILAIDAVNCVYANPIGSGVANQNSVPAILNQFGQAMNISTQGPTKQSVLVSAVGGSGAQPARKPVIEYALRKFLDTCRAQDRIIILFAGHAVEVDDQPYLVPIDGELDNTDDGLAWDKETLIPLEWVYERLKSCRARQKVLILDVCREDRGRGDERPAGGKMGAKLDAALKNPPAGVQVWSSCIAGQSSYETEVGNVSASVFLMQLAQSLQRFNQIHPGPQQPDEALPIQVLAQAVDANTKTAVSNLPIKDVVQTPRLVGEESNNGATYDPSEPVPAPIDLDVLVTGDLASAVLLQDILKEIDLPPLILTKPRPTGGLKPESLPPILARKMASYRADKGESELRKAVIKAVKVLNEQLPDDYRAKTFKDRYVPLANDNQFKNQIIDDQKKASNPLLPFMEALEELKKAGEERDKEESKRWQANYDFVLARLMLQIAYLYEYQSLLGSARKDVPEKDTKIGQNGWRVASQRKMQGDKAGRDLAKEAYGILRKVEKDHAGTLWEVLAKQDRLTHLGMHWEGAQVTGGRRR